MTQKKLHAMNIILVIQHTNNTLRIDFQPLVIDLDNHIKLYHGSHLMKSVVIDHESKA